MTRIRHRLADFVADQGGATAIEYGVIAGIISLAIVTAASRVGQAMLNFFETVIAEMGG